MFGLCILIIIYYVATNHQVKGSLAHTLKNQLKFNKKVRYIYNLVLFKICELLNNYEFDEYYLLKFFF